jgi:hypothetical protein
LVLVVLAGLLKQLQILLEIMDQTVVIQHLAHFYLHTVAVVGRVGLMVLEVLIRTAAVVAVH